MHKRYTSYVTQLLHVGRNGQQPKHRTTPKHINTLVSVPHFLFIAQSALQDLVDQAKMVKPRLIILIRHAQSEGNKNREVHQMIPDHRVKLTDEGHKQVRASFYQYRASSVPD